jgi:hypothetical protein
MKRHSRLHRVKRRVSSLQHRLIDQALLLGEATINGERAGDIGGVERFTLHSRVHQ